VVRSKEILPREKLHDRRVYKNIPSILVNNCQLEAEKVKAHLEENNPGVKVEELIEVYDNGNKRCSVMSLVKKDNRYTLSSKIYGSSEGSVVEDQPGLVNPDAAYGRDVRRVVLGVWASSKNSQLSVYMHNKNTGELLPVKVEMPFKAVGEDNAVPIIVDLPVDYTIVFFTNDCDGCNVVVEVIEMLEVSPDGNGILSDLKPKLIRVENESLTSTTPFPGWKEGNFRLDWVKDGKLYWEGNYRLNI
jgi:hypothetical protein